VFTIQGERIQTCAGSRREFLRVGALAMGGLTLPQILAAEARAGVRSNPKSVIMLFLSGGPPHIDMVDLKPEAPTEIRGYFKPIDTRVSGIQLCEHMSGLAARMDRLAIVRSVVGLRDEHASNQPLNGYSISEDRDRKLPALGAVASKLLGPVHPAVPPAVDIRVRSPHPPFSNEAHAGFLGRAHAPVQIDGPMMQDMTLRDITLSRLGQRRRMLTALDGFRREVDAVGAQGRLDETSARAFEILTDSKLVRAMDLSLEDPKTVERYGKGSPQLTGVNYNDRPNRLLMARRLVEAGVRCVTVGLGEWDFHSLSLDFIRNQIRQLDQALSALIDDLHDRGLDKDVSVVAWGEFGRSPKLGGYMNNYAAAGCREHWSAVSMAILAGGGMRTGQVVGATNRFGEYASERPVHYRDIHATLYHNLGIDVSSTELRDLDSRPVSLLPGHAPVAELV
jgi:hypothetical protein